MVRWFVKVTTERHVRIDQKRVTDISMLAMVMMQQETKYSCRTKGLTRMNWGSNIGFQSTLLAIEHKT